MIKDFNMKYKSLPYEVISQPDRFSLFNKEVEFEFQILTSKFLKELEKTQAREILIDEELNNYRNIFTDLSKVKFINRGQYWKILRSKNEYFGENKFLAIKLIYNLNIVRGRDYDLNMIDNYNVKELRKELSQGGDYYLENQIITEASYRYYNYLKLEYGIESDSKKKLEPIINLNKTDKLILLKCLSKAGLFPKRSPEETNKSYLEFLGIILDEAYDNLTGPEKQANKILDGRNPSLGESTSYVKRLENLYNTLTLDSLESTKDIISQRIKSLTNIK